MMRNRSYLNRLVVIACMALLCARPAAAQSGEGVQNHRKFFALPAEVDADFGAANGNATILRLMPLYTFPVFKDWKLMHTTIITLADAPSGTPAFPGSPDPGNNTGLADLLHASFYTPASDGRLIWGLGAIAGLPTATADGLGSDKWSAGPALRLTYRTGNWNFGALAGQRWSFAGSDNKPDVNQLLIRGVIRRQLQNEWYFVSAPMIVANWDAPEEKWLVPVGGGIGRRFILGGHPWAFSFQGYYNAIRPDGAPDWVIRFGMISAIPLGD